MYIICFFTLYKMELLTIELLSLIASPKGSCKSFLPQREGGYRDCDGSNSRANVRNLIKTASPKGSCKSFLPQREGGYRDCDGSNSRANVRNLIKTASFRSCFLSL